MIVERSLYDDFVAELVRRADSLPVGDPLDERSLIGPLVSERQLERVRSFLDLVEEEGGRLVTGGRSEGLYVWPTVVAELSPDSTIANGVRYGLGASVWTKDLDRALRVVRRLEAGDVWVNTHYVRQAETPFGGWKQSGLGRELGLAGVKEYLVWKRVAVDSAPDFHLRTWFERGR